MNNQVQKIIVLMLPIVTNGMALAADVDYELSAGGTYSDNIRRTGTLDESGSIASIGLMLNVDHESRLVDFGLNSDLGLNHYVDDEFDDEVVGALGANLNVILVQNFMTWGATNQFGKLQTNPFAADTEANRGNFNSFSTGPDIRIRLGKRTSLDIGGRYTNDYYEERTNDSEVASANLGLSRAISTNRSVSISVTYSDIDYDDGVTNSDYEVSAAFLSFQSEISKGQISASIGANEIEINNDTIDGTFAKFALSRELTPRTSLNLAYDQQFSNSGDVFRRAQNFAQLFGDTQDIPGDGEPFESRNLSATLNYDYGDNDFFIRAASDEEDYETDNVLERRRNEIRIGVSRRLGSKWRVSANGRLSQLDYKNVDRDDDDMDIGLGVSRKLTRTLHLNFDYRYVDRSSSSVGADFSENRYSLTLRIDPE